MQKFISIIFLRLNHLIKTFPFAFLIFCWFCDLLFSPQTVRSLSSSLYTGDSAYSFLYRSLTPFVSLACSISNSLCNNEGEFNLIPGKVDGKKAATQPTNKQSSRTTNQTTNWINKQPTIPVSQPIHRSIPWQLLLFYIFLCGSFRIFVFLHVG